MMATSSATPLEIRRLGAVELPPAGGMSVEWNDGLKHILPGELIRRACPCATCQESRGESPHAKPFSGRSRLLQVVEATAIESASLERIEPVGNYAISLRWADGHDTGIYSFALLRELGGRVSIS